RRGRGACAPRSLTRNLNGSLFVVPQSDCSPTPGSLYYPLPDSSSQSFIRPIIAELSTVPADNSSRRSVAGISYRVVAMPPARIPAGFRMSPAGKRQRSRQGGHHERRTHGASARDQSPSRRPIPHADRGDPESRRDLIPQVVSPLSGGRPRGP